MPTPNREQALALFLRYNKSESLIKHGLMVESVMRQFARRYGADEDHWGVIGLIHDLDYEQFPQQHCQKTREILQQEGWDAADVRAVVSHGYGLCSDEAPETDLEKVLYAIDELTGLIAATVYMRPSRSVMDLEVKSVMKKWKTPSFAAGVNREIIAKGCEQLGLSVEEVVAECIAGMRKDAEALGLLGNA